MQDDHIECPFCGSQHPLERHMYREEFACELTGCVLEVSLSVSRNPMTRNDWVGVLAATRHLREEHSVENARLEDDHVEGIDPGGVKQRTPILGKPSIEGQARLALRHLVRRSKHFGQPVLVEPSKDFPVSHAANSDEFFAILELLNERGWAKHGGASNVGHRFSVTAEGHAVHDRVGTSGLTVFVSSTVWDLLDCRTELASFLESLGCDVRLSEDPERFDSSTQVDSIQSCLQNLGQSDVVVCFLDQRYGAPLPAYQDRSATHVEIDYAKELGKPILTFIRDKSFSEFSTLKRTPTARTNWVEKDNEPNRERWVQFVQDHVSLPRERSERSNWVDQFRTIVDLKRMVRLKLEQLNARGELTK